MSEPATLTGLAIGDALGMPFETLHWTSSALGSWDGSFMSGISNELQPGRQPGEWTDDTKMAKALAESLVEFETYNPPATAAGYIQWYKSGDHRGMGKATREALEKILRGFHWVDAGVASEGNGTAMRVAPIGLFYRNSLMTAMEMARIDARITHISLEAEVGSMAIAGAVAMLANQLVKPSNLVFALNQVLEEGSVISKKLRQLELDLKEGSFEDPAQSLGHLIEMGTGAHVVETVPAALFCFSVTSSFSEAVELAVRAGGDTDTTAAITGALAGTYYGTDQVEPYLDQLEEADLLQFLDHTMYLTSPKIPAT